MNGTVSFVAENPVRAVSSHTQAWLSRWYKEVSFRVPWRTYETHGYPRTPSYSFPKRIASGQPSTVGPSRPNATATSFSHRNEGSARCCTTIKRMCSSGLRNGRRPVSQRRAARKAKGKGKGGQAARQANVRLFRSFRWVDEIVRRGMLEINSSRLVLSEYIYNINGLPALRAASGTIILHHFLRSHSGCVFHCTVLCSVSQLPLTPRHSNEQKTLTSNQNTTPHRNTRPNRAIPRHA